jgi:hypothetical protein
MEVFQKNVDEETLALPNLLAQALIGMGSSQSVMPLA